MVDLLPQTKVWNYGLGVAGALGVLWAGSVLKKRSQTPLA
jgi:hypothetical protein